MPTSTIALTAPIDLASLPDHPAINFYKKYGAAFQTNLEGTQPTRFYDSDVINYLTTCSPGGERDAIHGAQNCWNAFLKLYATFERNSYEILTFTVVSDEERGTHVIHMEAITSLHLKHGKGFVRVPQMFVYTIGKAKDGEGTDGLAFKEVRNYYNPDDIEKAKAQEG